MERIWAPWRKTYIIGSRESGCIFCLKPARHEDRETLILERGETCFTIMNIFPYNNGHLMVAPFRHTGNLEDLDDRELFELFASVRKWIGIIRKAYHPEGFNIGMNLGTVAGAGFAEHLHVHLVPRWNGDTNFMPVIGETKVISESLEASYEALLAALRGDL
ncbi:MAG: HIT domain-containing protein [bacterium]